jgi:hypothetical protein
VRSGVRMVDRCTLRGKAGAGYGAMGLSYGGIMYLVPGVLYMSLNDWVSESSGLGTEFGVGLLCVTHGKNFPSAKEMGYDCIPQQH